MPSKPRFTSNSTSSLRNFCSSCYTNTDRTEVLQSNFAGLEYCCSRIEFNLIYTWLWNGLAVMVPALLIPSKIGAAQASEAYCLPKCQQIFLTHNGTEERQWKGIRKNITWWRNTMATQESRIHVWLRYKYLTAVLLNLLPNKNQLRKRGKKRIFAAILDIWMMKEDDSILFRTEWLRKSGADISNSENSSSTMDLTRLSKNFRKPMTFQRRQPIYQVLILPIGTESGMSSRPKSTTSGASETAKIFTIPMTEIPPQR